MRKIKKNNYVKGNFTIEASFVIPLVLFVFVVLVNILFYYHDKNMLTAVAHETVSIGSGRTAQSEEELEQYFYNRIQGKMLLLTRVQSDVSADETSTNLTCRASGKRLVLQVDCEMSKTQPETHIREIKRLENQIENLL